MFQLVEKNYRLLGGGAARHGGEQLILAYLAGPGLLPRVAFGLLVKGDLAEGLEQGDADQQTAQVVVVAQNEIAGLGVAEEGAKDGLDHVLGIDPAGEARTDPLASQVQQL